MNSYPFLDNKLRPTFTAELGDITPKVRSHRVIDISNSPLVSAQNLRQKLDRLHDAGELDGGLPIVRHGVLVGLIPAPDLEFALDKLEDEEKAFCLMATDISWHGGEENDEEQQDPTDFTPYIDSVSKMFFVVGQWSGSLTKFLQTPMALDIRSPMDLVFQCFVKLGLRYICVLRDGQYGGLIHKKTFVKYVNELESARET